MRKKILMMGKPSQYCSECTLVVLPQDPYYHTPCGPFCEDHMRDHVKECESCRKEFGFVQEDPCD